MNILYFTNLYPPVVSGSSVQARSLALCMADKGHECVIITSHVDPETPAYEERGGVHIYRLPCFRLPKMEISLNFPWLNAMTYPGNFKRVQEIAAKHNIDLIHVHNHMFDSALMARRLAKKIKKPLIVTLHTIITHIKRAYNYILVPLDRHFIGSMVVCHANAVICPDENMKTYLQQRFGRNDGTLIPYGIDLPEQSNSKLRQEIEEKFNLTGRRMMLSLGHMHALRNRISLIQALPDVVKKHPDFVVAIVGSVTDNRAETLVKELGLEKHVIFTGTQPRASVREFHELCLFEGSWLDQDENGMNSLGIAGMEAMFMGRAMISRANIDTFGSGVLKFGENIYCKPDLSVEDIKEIILSLLDTPDHAKHVGTNAYKLANEHFSWPSAAEKTLALYKTLVNEKDNENNAARVKAA